MRGGFLPSWSRSRGPQQRTSPAVTIKMRTRPASVKRQRACSAVLALIVIAETTAVAQDPGTPDTVVVYAQKRAAPLQDVPMSVSILTDTDLADAGIHDIEGVATSMPTLDMQRSVSPLTTTLRIRRVGSLGNIPTFEPAVGLFVDGAYRSRSLLGTGELLDVDHVEVLSGPQSSLYGRSVSAGVVSIYTRRPDQTVQGRCRVHRRSRRFFEINGHGQSEDRRQRPTLGNARR